MKHWIGLMIMALQAIKQHSGLLQGKSWKIYARQDHEEAE
jgi:hypothetical protein